jgi:hypothetical protein
MRSRWVARGLAAALRTREFTAYAEAAKNAKGQTRLVRQGGLTCVSPGIFAWIFRNTHGVAVLCLVIAFGGLACEREPARTALEITICQDTDLILFSEFGEPPQIVVWLEDPADGRLRTVFVTYRTGSGDWEGKSECPGSLPRWYQIYELETGVPGMPRPETPVPDGVSGATVKTECFTRSRDMEPGSRWVCWIEMNLAGDYSEHFQQLDEQTGMMDTDHSGQPALLYRAEITIEAGNSAVPELWGYSDPSAEGGIVRDLSRITTAKDVLTSLEVKVATP